MAPDQPGFKIQLEVALRKPLSSSWVLSVFTCKMGINTHILQSSFKRQNDMYEVASLPLRIGGGGMTVIMSKGPLEH